MNRALKENRYVLCVLQGTPGPPAHTMLPFNKLHMYTGWGTRSPNRWQGSPPAGRGVVTSAGRGLRLRNPRSALEIDVACLIILEVAVRHALCPVSVLSVVPCSSLARARWCRC